MEAAATATPAQAAVELLQQQLLAKEAQLERLMRNEGTGMRKEPEVVEESAEVVELKRKLRKEEETARNLKRKVEEAEAAAKEKEMEERMERRMQHAMKQRTEELEARYAATSEPRVRPTVSPLKVHTAGFSVRSGTGAWADMEAREAEQREETRKKEQENKELREKEMRQQEENQRLRSRLADMEARMPPPQVGAGVFPRADEVGSGGAMTDEQLIDERTSELAGWAEQEGGSEKHKEWQDLCVVHHIKHSRAPWPKSATGRRAWSNKVAKAEVELTEPR
jgi:hypothetical protein